MSEATTANGAPSKAACAEKVRLGALRRFAAAITILNLLGHTVLGFEQSWLHPLVALATAYSTEILLEHLGAWAQGRRARFPGRTVVESIDFLLSAHITALACAMLTYTSNHYWPVVFATTVAVGSKTLLRVPVGKGSRHFMNPSNLGIAAALLAFPHILNAPAYQFTENLPPAGAIILPVVICCTGSFLNGKLTRRLPLIAGWLGAFFLQAVTRSLLQGTPFFATLMPMTGPAFILFTFYMVTDPATTPSEWRCQMMFGAMVALFYAFFMAIHQVYGLFYALCLVCTFRGLSMYLWSIAPEPTRTRVAVLAPVLVGRA